jgi:predicted unusual protein kinase regulating ubiquinone biosynthesis (AarF/ABC1/UbiB family)
MANQEKRKNTLTRAGQIIFVLAEFFVFYKLSRHRHKSLGARMRETCERLGLVFIKVGQVLSTRYDLLSATDCKELQTSSRRDICAI